MGFWENKEHGWSKKIIAYETGLATARVEFAGNTMWKRSSKHLFITQSVENSSLLA